MDFVSNSTLNRTTATRITRGLDLVLATLLVENIEGEMAPEEVREDLLNIVATARRHMEDLSGVKIDPGASFNPSLRPACEVADDIIDSLD